MNDDRHAYWSAYLRFLADQLILRDHHIELSRETPHDADAAASVWVNKGAQCATVYLEYGWEALSPEKQRWFCLHELLHIHLDRIDTVLDLMNQRVDSPVAQFSRDLLKNEIEFAVDDLARALVPFFPTAQEWYARAQEDRNGPESTP